MSFLQKIGSEAGKFLHKNASTILTCVGGIGVVATAVLAAKATPKAICLVVEAEVDKGEKLTKLETVVAASPAYIPTVITGVSTVACIVGANILNKHRQASLMSAYALLDVSFKKYREKVKELYGDDADDRVRKEIMKDEYDDFENSVTKENLIFFDNHSLRFFESTIEDLLNVERQFNADFETRGYICLNDFYDMVGLARTEYGAEVGWSIDSMREFYNHASIEFRHEKVKFADGMEGYIVIIDNDPIIEYLY
ncbi:MAG: hypothetical protein J6Q84_07235 [Kiritimatiellae bacterium]|nr:hypothetical protein [Kiritimatiellia bacterium]